MQIFNCKSLLSGNLKPENLVLLTNGIGGMARLCVDLGAVKSKYDCLLGANLDPKVPVDRHVFAKRARLDRARYEQVAARWQQLRLPGQPPRITAFEETSAVSYHEAQEPWTTSQGSAAALPEDSPPM